MRSFLNLIPPISNDDCLIITNVSLMGGRSDAIQRDIQWTHMSRRVLQTFRETFSGHTCLVEYHRHSERHSVDTHVSQSTTDIRRDIQWTHVSRRVLQTFEETFSGHTCLVEYYRHSERHSVNTHVSQSTTFVQLLLHKIMLIIMIVNLLTMKMRSLL